MERCRSGLTGWFRKPLSALRTGGSNPSLSAILQIQPFGEILPHGKATQQARSARQSPTLQQFATAPRGEKEIFCFLDFRTTDRVLVAVLKMSLKL